MTHLDNPLVPGVKCVAPRIESLNCLFMRIIGIRPASVRAFGRIATRAACVLGIILATSGQVRSQTPSPDEGLVQWAIFRGQMLPYVVIDGMAVHDDMVLGRAENFQAEPANTVSRKPVGRGLPEPRQSYASSHYQLWPDAVMPYVIDDGFPDNERQVIQEAIKEWNVKTVITLVSRTTEEDYVLFKASDGSQCSSSVGRIGSEQSIHLSLENECAAHFGIVVHEIGHAVGLMHEHQRPDRDYYVMCSDHDKVQYYDYNMYANIVDHAPDNSEIKGPYDYASQMHYIPFHTNCETIPPGMDVQMDTGGLSAGDIDGVAKLYGRPPATYLINTNPPGLDIVVDGLPVTTPKSFDWPLGSTHVLEAPVVQEGDATRFVFGRWNDGGHRRHTVTASPDSTWMEANYIRQYHILTRANPPKRAA